MRRLALALGLLLACGDGPPQRKPPPPLPGEAALELPQGAAADPAAAPPDAQDARDLTALCLTTATLAPNLPPPDRFRRAFLTAEAAAVSPDSQALLARLRAQDLAEQAAELRRAAEAAGLAGCLLADAMDLVAAAEPNPADARALVSVLEALAMVSPEYKDRILAAGCSEMPACGRECTMGLAGLAEAEPDQRVVALMRQCAAFRAQAGDGSEDTAFAWIRARVGAFADASAGLLPPADATRIAELRKALAL